MDLDQRWEIYKRHIEENKAPQGTVSLPEVLRALGADIRAAQADAREEKEATFKVKDASVELDVTVTWDAEGSGEVAFWVFTKVDFDLKREGSTGTKITIDLLPIGTEVAPVDLR